MKADVRWWALWGARLRRPPEVFKIIPGIRALLADAGNAAWE